MAEDVNLQGYDEDLSENPFFKYLQTKHKSIYEEVAKNRWTICVPRRGTLSRSNHTQSDVESHIFQAVDHSSSMLKTLNGKNVQANDGFIITTEGFKDVKSVRILFEETFFNSSNESFQVLCLDQPLEGGIGVSAEPVVQTLEDLQGCIDFLWPTGTKQGQKQIDEIIQMRTSTYRQLEGESLRHLMDAANAIYTRAMQGALKNWQLRKLAKNNKSYLDNVKLAIETYVMHGLNSQLMKGISAIVGNEDAALNKITRNLVEIQIRDIGIKPELCPNLPRARRILSLLNKYTSPLEKFHCLKKSITIITERKLKENEQVAGGKPLRAIFAYFQGRSDAVTADDLLPALVFLVIKSDIPNWLANITFLHNFHFSKAGYSEFQFYLASLEAAVEHVRSGYVSNAFKGGSPFKRLQNGVPGLLWQPVDHDSSRPTALDNLFEFAADGSEVEVGKLLANEEADKERLGKMCHPLCSCDKCEKLLSSKRNDPSAVTVFSRDDMGRTVLHVAAEWGHANLTYNLIHKGAVVNAMDYHGTTPLHLACLRGHNKVVLLLVHYKADTNSTDNDGNTPLHLCAANGHEQSLKSLLYCDMTLNVLKINASNENGDTPLHLASRWGYVEIVNQLIEKGASVEARNKNQDTPLECAHNQQVSDLLLDVTASNMDMESELLDPVKSTKPLGIAHSPPRPTLAGSPTGSLENTAHREIGTFLRSVADGDLAMVRYRLGLEDGEFEYDEDEEDLTDCRSDQDLCHPLCQCDKCSKWQKLTQRSLERAVHANCTNEDGISALQVGAVRGYEAITSLLLRHGANPNHRNTTRQQTALHLACQYNHPNVVELLLNHQAKINAKDSRGNTPLHFCCINGHVTPAIVLLQRRANVDVVNDRGNTPLHEAARWNFVELVRLLLKYRASVTMRNKMQLTAMQYAKHDDVVRILENAERLAESMLRSARASTWSGELTKPINATERPSRIDSLEVEGMVSGSPKSLTKIPSGNRARYSVPQETTPVVLPSASDPSGPATPTRGNNISSRDPASAARILMDPASPASDARIPRDPASPSRDPVCSAGRDRAHSDTSMLDTSLAAPQTKLSQIFEQLEGGDIEKLQEIAKAVRAFDRRKSLKTAVTIDRSAPLLEGYRQQQLKRQQQLPIDFENIALRKGDSIDEGLLLAIGRPNKDLVDNARAALGSLHFTNNLPQKAEPYDNAVESPLLDRVRKNLMESDLDVGQPKFYNAPLLERVRKVLEPAEVDVLETPPIKELDAQSCVPSKVVPINKEQEEGTDGDNGLLFEQEEKKAGVQLHMSKESSMEPPKVGADLSKAETNEESRTDEQLQRAIPLPPASDETESARQVSEGWRSEETSASSVEVPGQAELKSCEHGGFAFMDLQEDYYKEETSLPPDQMGTLSEHTTESTAHGELDLKSGEGFTFVDINYDDTTATPVKNELRVESITGVDASDVETSQRSPDLPENIPKQDD